MKTSNQIPDTCGHTEQEWGETINESLHTDGERIGRGKYSNISRDFLEDCPCCGNMSILNDDLLYCLNCGLPLAKLSPID